MGCVNKSLVVNSFLPTLFLLSSILLLPSNQSTRTPPVKTHPLPLRKYTPWRIYQQINCSPGWVCNFMAFDWAIVPLEKQKQLPFQNNLAIILPIC